MPVPAIRYAAPLLAEQEQLWHQQAHPRRHDGRILATCQRIAKRAVLLQTLSMASGALAQQSPASLAQLSLQPSSVVWASSSTGTVTLTAPTPNPAIIQLTSDAIGRHISMPASVTVPAGGVSASFPITTDQVFVNQSGMVTATFNGARKTAALSVVVPDVVSINCTPSRLPALATTRCSVTMNGPAPLPTAIFAHSSDVTIVPVPQSIDITVPAKATGISFDVTTGLVPAQTTVTISAHAGTNTVGAFTNLEVDLTTRGRKWVLQNVVLRDGGTVTGYFNYDAATGAYLDANVTATPGANGTGNWGIKPASFPWLYPVHGGITGDPVKAGGSTPSKLVLLNSYQDPDNIERREFVYLRLMFSQPLTNAGGTVPLVIDPAAPVSPTCTVDPSCKFPPSTISFEGWDIPITTSTPPAHSYRLVIDGSVQAQ